MLRLAYSMVDMITFTISGDSGITLSTFLISGDLIYSMRSTSLPEKQKRPLNQNKP